MNETVLIHHGIKGQRWGVRRFQNEDGSLTSIGKKRYRNDESAKGLTDAQKAILKKAAIGVGIAAMAGLATYGAVKYSDAFKDQDFLKSVDFGNKVVQEKSKESVSKLVEGAKKASKKDTLSYEELEKRASQVTEIEKTRKEIIDKLKKNIDDGVNVEASKRSLDIVNKKFDKKIEEIALT